MNDPIHRAEDLLFEIGTRFGHDHARNAERFRLHWENHVRRSRQLILSGAQRVTAPNSVTILGAGAAYNLPLEELAQRFTALRLIDIDRDGLQRTLDELTAAAREKITIEIADAMGGAAVRLLASALEIIEAESDSAQAVQRLVSLFSGESREAMAGNRLQQWKASYVVSSGLSSQSTIFPERAVAKQYAEKFGVGLPNDFFFKSGSFRLRHDWVRHHGEFLSSLVLPGGRVYWADTVAETPCLSQSGDRYLSAIVDSVVRFLEKTYLKTFLREAGKEKLSERLAQNSSTRLPSDQILRGFSNKFDSESKRRVAWAIMTLTGEDAIQPNKELELLEHVIREAERVSPLALQPILNGRLSAFVPSTLELDREVISWKWINDPEATITLAGGTYSVDAQILKPKLAT